MSRAAARRRAPSPARPRRPAPLAVLFRGHAELDPAEDRLYTRLAWAVALVLAIALIAMALGPHKVGDYFTETDFYGAYADGATLIQHGHVDPKRYGVIGPVYEFVLAGVGLVVRDLFLAAELISIAATVAIALLLFHLLRRRVDARLGFFAVLFLATNSYFFRYGYAATTDALAIALEVAALALLLTRTGDRGALATGLVAAAAFLTRYNAVFLLPAGLIAIAAGHGPPRRGRAALLFAAGFLALVVPWVLVSLAGGGKFEFQLHHNIAYEVFAHARGITWDDYQAKLQPQFHSLADVIARDPGAVVQRMLFNVVDHVRSDASSLLGWPIAVVALVGLLFVLLDGSWRRLWPIGVAAALLFLTLVPVFYSERYSLALLPAYATLAGAAFASPILALAIARAPRVWLKPALALLPLGFALQSSIRFERRVLDQLPVEVLGCAQTLRELAAPGDLVIARKAHVGYHSGLRAIGFPFATTIPELADYAHRSRARWLFFSWPEAETRPALAFLVDTSAVVPGLTVRRVTRPHPAVLYEIGPEFGRVPEWFPNDTLRAWHNARAMTLVDGGSAKYQLQLGGVAFVMGRDEDARRALTIAAQIEPRNLDALLLLGNVLLRLEDADGAARVYAHARSVDPRNAEASVGFGWAALALGHDQDAATAWRPVIAATTNRSVLVQMVRLYERLGDRESETAARRALDRVGGGP